ncbi:MAG TPA: hypothetical protein VMX13_01670 [Sedimentisphaerales bacterium]|nr:hypothetical protein [Sedimentisphaerales bacterium]
MDGQNYLGIYLSKGSATVVCLGSRGREKAMIGGFSVSLEEQRERNISADIAELARLVAEGCASRDLKFSDVAVALDCSMFMQHSVHSEFKETRQIAQTVRFDTEEALSTDISDVALAFEIASTDESGSELTVFTTRREILSAVLLSLQSHNIDPITVEPDINSLSRFILQHVSLPEDSNCLVALLSGASGYFVGCVRSRQTPFKRTFLVHRTQDRTALLARQIPLTVALAAAGEPISSLRIFDSAGSADSREIGRKLGIEAAGFDLLGSVGAEPSVLADCGDTVNFAIACGAALTHSEKGQGVNFRDDFMPYQGKKLRLQKTLKVLSFSVTILMVALGTYVTSQLLQMNKYRGRLRDRFKGEYAAVMPQRKLPQSVKSGARSLVGELKRTQDLVIGTVGGQGEQSVLAKLTLVLEAFNKSTGRTGLDIDSISITDKSVTIAGSTSGRGNTLKVRNAIKQMKLGNVQERLELKPTGGDSFKFTILPEK